MGFNEALVARKHLRHLDTNVKAMYMERTNLNRLKAVLAEQNRTGVWLAGQMGKNVATISRWASNKAQPSVEQLFEISRILGVDVKDLLVSQPQTEKSSM